jgi:hypothetical protein
MPSTKQQTTGSRIYREHTFEDARAAMRAYNTVLDAAASDDQHYHAEQAMLAESGGRAGRRAYFASLDASASDSARKSARVSYSATLAELRSARELAEAQAAEQAAMASGDAASWHPVSPQDELAQFCHDNPGECADHSQHGGEYSTI